MARTTETVLLSDIQHHRPLYGNSIPIAEQYAVRMAAGDVFPPINLIRSDRTKILTVSDGKHRIYAMRKLNWLTCEAVIDSNRD
jgi:hypothetical protein